MFILKDYIKKGFLDAVGKMADYWIILNSSGYHDKGVLTEEDLAEIQTAIDAQYPQVEVEDEIMEDEVVSDGVVEDETSVENVESESNNEPVETESETEVIS